MSPWFLRFERIIGFAIILTRWSCLNRHGFELSTSISITAGKFDLSALPPAQLGLWLTFFLLVAVSMGMLFR